MSGGASSSKNQQKSESSPWIGQQPYLSDVFRKAQGLYNRGPQQYYPGQTYTDFNAIQQDAMGAQLDRAQGSSQEAALGNYINNQLGQQQFNLGGAGQAAQQAASGVAPGQQMIGQAGMSGPTIGAASQFAQGGANTLGAQGAADFIGQQAVGSDPFSQYAQQLGNAGTAAQAQDTLSQTARGDFVGGNPYLDQQFDQASRRVREQFQDTVNPGINATFGGAGRTGSGIHQEVMSDAAGELGDTLGGMASNIYGDAYNRERTNQLSAGSQLGQLGLGAAGLGGELQLGKAGQALGQNQFEQGNALGQNALAANLYNRGQDRQLDAGSTLLSGGLGGAGQMGDLYSRVGNQQQGAAGLVPGMTDLQYNNIDRAADVGNQVQGQSERALQDDINRFNYNQQAPQDLLNNYAALIMQQNLQQSSGKSKGTTKSAGG